MRPPVPLALIAAAAVLLAGCSRDPGPGPAAAGEPVPVLSMADCAALTAPPPDAPATAGHSADQLPELTLPCFVDEQPFPLAQLRGPAVVNLWASFCLPCLEELPVLQRFADRAAGQVHVVGVVTADSHTKAAWLADDLDLRFPSLYDRDERLSIALGRYGLPVTAFVDAQGRLVHVYQGEPFDDQRLGALVEEHLGVAVEGG